MQRLFWLLFVPPLLILSGCGPRISQEDLGTVLDKLPEVSKEPYDMTNRLGPPLPQDPDMQPPF